MSAAVCPACSASRMTVFFELSGVPAHSCLLVDSREEALAFPRGDIVLAVCHACGFISNLAFDAGLNQYSSRYEESQAYSPHFMAFAGDLARRWVDRHELQGKRVLEIGCGKGEFLVEMAKAGAGPSIGIDPGVIPGRIEGAATLPVRWVQDFFDQRYLDLPADAVVCRHTLEHIHPVAGFMALVRQLTRLQGTRTVLFELPDTLRVLQEAAFWDIYYEHCSYFTPGSLSRLFRRFGFRVEALELAYDGQYILLEARPGGPVCETPPLEEPVHDVCEAVRSFDKVYREQIGRWSADLAGWRRAGKRVAIWGGGSKGVAFLSTLDPDGYISAAVDINPRKWGKFMAGTGHPVIAPAELQAAPPDVVVAMNPVYCDEIRGDLDRLGIAAELRAV
ncbi:MAG: methyltransferase domain-containing protein [Dehalococcoidia bacterium]|nr:methyltransferase domain-containing protein [Dehalococcoidia bacterium]